MRKANLLIVGAPKCGTTAWFEYLSSHPDIFFPPAKEDCYFALDLPNFRFVRSEAEYSKLFADSGSAKIVGEASAMYLFSTAAAAAIQEYNPEAKILIFLRDQEEYLPSLHNQFLREFSEEIEDFQIAWRLSGRRPSETIPPGCLEPRTLDYAAMGRFCEQVGRYFDAFPAEQVRVIRFRDWTANPRATYLEILEFLELEDDGRSDFPRVNPGTTYRSRRLVRFIFRPPNIVRKAARFLKRMTGLSSATISAAVRKTVGVLSAEEYNKDLDPRLCEEIRRYYAEDNRHLEERLRHREKAQRCIEPAPALAAARARNATPMGAAHSTRLRS